MAQWTDMFVRKSLNDTGANPYPGGDWTSSPDIIPNGPTVDPNPAATFGAASYGSDLGKATNFEQTNYFYARAKNLSAGAQTGTLYLYYCPQNLFLFPSLWANNQMKTSSGKNSVALSAAKTNDVAVTPEPFTYVPTNNIHSCLIARLVTPTTPNPLPNDGDFTTMSDLAAFICKHPNYAWRNVVLVESGVPTFTNTFQIDTTSLQPGSQAQFLIGISFKNLSTGSQLAFSAGTPIPSGPDVGKIIQLVQSAIPQSSGSMGSQILTIPAGYKTNVSYSYWANPPIQAGWQVQFYAIQLVSPTEAELHALASPLHELDVPGLTPQHPLLALANSDMRGVLVGSVSTVGV